MRENTADPNPESGGRGPGCRARTVAAYRGPAVTGGRDVISHRRHPLGFGLVVTFALLTAVCSSNSTPSNQAGGPGGTTKGTTPPV
jgi:hypothetical protein